MFKFRHLAVLAGFAALSAAAPQALAAPCAGFNDIDDTNPDQSAFCPSIEWVRNRGVFLGLSSTIYDPNNPLTRMQMAAVVKRLGDALTGQVLQQTESTGPINLDLPESDAAAHQCKVGPVAAVGYPRRAIVYAQLSGVAADSLQVFAATSASVDGGAFARTAPSGIGMRAHATGNVWTNVTQTASVDMDAGKTYAFAFFVQRALEDAGTNDMTVGRCNMTVFIGSRTGTATPFDPATSALDNAR